ncbi:DEAD/DEAH box helicase [Exiguobacterium sp. JMULE1]|uniref:DEAD/DEAH box helicase n=1 Tax=Exiguobacterium sp. JMULE1 TaxID=2518339 RepID=UPI0015754237|nr:DEAD/DEAH box helicase [Exiguobacterium sp. JMULE1]NTY10351.1 DEAD/DEAH box helicase [Exiguobacterium sp. JMULE1]
MTLISRPFKQSTLCRTDLVESVTTTLETSGKTVTESQESHFYRMVDVLVNRRAYDKKVAIVADVGLGKTLLITRFIEATAKHSGSPIVVVVPRVEVVDELVTAANEAREGSAIAIRRKDSFVDETDYARQLDVAHEFRIVILTHAMFRIALDSGMFDSRLAQFTGVVGTLKDTRSIIVDEQLPLLREHAISRSSLSMIMTNLENVVENTRRFTGTNFAVRSFEEVRQHIRNLSDVIDRTERESFHAKRIPAINEAFSLPPSLVEQARARFGFDFERLLKSFEFIVKTGARLEWKQTKTDGVYLTDNLGASVNDFGLSCFESLAGSLNPYDVVFFDATAEFDAMYDLLPSLQTIRPETPVFDYSNLTIRVCNAVTASKRWASSPDNIERLRYLVEGELMLEHEQLLVSVFKGDPMELLMKRLAAVNPDSVLYKPNDSGRGVNDYEHADAILQVGTAIPAAITNIAIGDSRYPDEQIDGHYKPDRSASILYADPLVQGVVNSHIGVTTIQNIGRLRPGRKEDALTAYLLAVPDEAVAMIAQAFPGAKIIHEPILKGEYSDTVKAIADLLQTHDEPELKKALICSAIGIAPNSLTRALRENQTLNRVFTVHGYERVSTQKYKKSN